MEAIHLVGAGGIGCAVGYALRRAGAPVVFVDAAAEKIAWGRQHGVGVDRRPPLPAKFQSFTAWEPPAGANVFLFTTCSDNAPLPAPPPPARTPLPAQNP